ncbi:nuclear transport factor 2 family protein [Cyanobium gracile]|uniref:Nuclear transport factor 2 family protein n=1 Tax=Cyanobium gracile UHCC 0281 TaxID=3110309 RepID=A0ABU5T084_9CYAN|nr:nuclear transport factor 2 family protein [Cyanobium gracile]MEA5444186.1 nuclear transport factor 2 family protein [Cyanobium gracile UHCC 0281]
MITSDVAHRFADESIQAWSSHGLPAVLSHDTDQPTGILKGKNQVAAYWSAALEIMPTLQVELHKVLIGVDSVPLTYRGANGPAADLFLFNDQGLVRKAHSIPMASGLTR